MNQNPEVLRQGAVQYLQNLLNQGKPYVWAGDDYAGYDCSGIANEVLKAVGLIRPDEDLTAEGLYQRYKNNVSDPKPGCLKFWFSWSAAINRKYASHVEIFFTELFLIGASGGGSPKLTPEKILNEFPALRQIIPSGSSENSNIFYWALKQLIFRFEAERRGAFVKMRIHTYRSGDSIIVDPFKIIP